LEDFKNNPTAQAQAIATYHQRVWSYIKAQGLESYVGQTVGGVEMTQSGMIAAAHLVGSGNLAAFLRSDGRSVPRDGNNTPITEYISRFGGYTITGSGSNCTQFASGHPSGGVKVPVPTPSGPTHAAPGVRVVTDGPAAGTINPDEAYYSVTGHSADQLARTIKLLVVSVVMLAAAGCWLGSWTLFSAGASTWHRFLHDNQRLLVVVLLFLVVLA
ncbi:MAG: hypothetical protein JF606_15305, partial [Burkholderiales bacterium]|nr:hypothetical protein [Burkholderiales bacterium]